MYFNSSSRYPGDFHNPAMLPTLVDRGKLSGSTTSAAIEHLCRGIPSKTSVAVRSNLLCSWHRQCPPSLLAYICNLFLKCSRELLDSHAMSCVTNCHGSAIPLSVAKSKTVEFSFSFETPSSDLQVPLDLAPYSSNLARVQSPHV